MLVRMRNNKVRRAFLAKHHDHTEGPNAFEIIFVSNTWYRAHLSECDEDESIPGSVEASGIPGLRQEIARLPAQRRFDRLETFCEGWLWSSINSLDMWARSSAIERRQELRKVVEKPNDVGRRQLIARTSC